MTNQEASNILDLMINLDNNGHVPNRDLVVEAIQMAIEALETQSHIVNCPDCKYAMRNQGELWVCGHPNNNAWRITDDFFCGRGMT
jgi:hypothetical protein